MEKPLIAAAMRSRQNYGLIQHYIDTKQASYSAEFKVVLGKIKDYYDLDRDADSVSGEVLMAQIGENVRSDKLSNRLFDFIGESLAETSSDLNVKAAILAARQQEVGDKLAAVLSADGAASNPKVDALIEELNELRNMTDLEELSNSDIEVYQDVDLEALMSSEYDPANLIKLYPTALNDRMDGGVRKGHHLLVYGRPESGKSACVINASAGFARQNKRVLYGINEDRPQDIIIRHVSNLSGMTKHEVRDNPRKAMDIASNHGWGNVVVVSMAPGTPRQLADLVEKYDPDVVVVDQLRNLAMKAENRVNQLEAAATAVRNLAKQANVVALSVTQAGDSAEGKLILDQGDVDFSNTGIPGQADVMIGIGVDATHEAENLRIISLPKNKVGGVHDHFPVRIIPSLSRYTSL